MSDPIIAKARKILEEASMNYFQINYRIKSDYSDEMGKSDSERRNDLIGLIEQIDGNEKHSSTSSWIVKTSMENSISIREKIKSAVDPEIDFISVVEIVSDDFATYGNPPDFV